VLNAQSLLTKLQGINAANSIPKEEVENLRMSIKNQKGLQDLFQKKDDESECKVFRLSINAAVEI